MLYLRIAPMGIDLFLKNLKNKRLLWLKIAIKEYRGLGSLADNFINCPLSGEYADNFGILRTILRKKSKFQILADYFWIWRTILEIGGQLSPDNRIYNISNWSFFFNTDNLYIHNFRGQFQNLTDNFWIWRTKIFFPNFWRTILEIGGHLSADNRCPRTIVRETPKTR